MDPARSSASLSFLLPGLLAACVATALVGCDSGGPIEVEESETTRAIREKVRADMERDRLERIGRRLAAVNESLAGAPTAVKLAVAEDTHDEEAPDPIDLASGEATYTQNCASCHGPRGGGDGPLSAGLQPQPAKHADGGYMNALSNEHIYKVISQGGAAVGKSSMMAPWGTSLSENQIRSLVGFIRTLADPAYEGPAPEGF